jgi:hypothetical protein
MMQTSPVQQIHHARQEHGLDVQAGIGNLSRTYIMDSKSQCVKNRSANPALQQSAICNTQPQDIQTSALCTTNKSLPKPEYASDESGVGHCEEATIRKEPTTNCFTKAPERIHNTFSTRIRLKKQHAKSCHISNLLHKLASQQIVQKATSKSCADGQTTQCNAAHGVFSETKPSTHLWAE